MQDWENFKDRRSLIFLTDGMLGNQLSARGWFGILDLRVSEAGKSFPKHGLNAPMFGR